MDRTSSPSLEISHNDTAARARELWYARHCPIGQDEEIWLEAERQLKAEQRTNPGSGSKSSTGHTAIDLDERKLAERLDTIGEAPRRSATSIDPTR